MVRCCRCLPSGRRQAHFCPPDALLQQPPCAAGPNVPVELPSPGQVLCAQEIAAKTSRGTGVSGLLGSVHLTRQAPHVHPLPRGPHSVATVSMAPLSVWAGCASVGLAAPQWPTGLCCRGESGGPGPLDLGAGILLQVSTCRAGTLLTTSTDVNSGSVTLTDRFHQGPRRTTWALVTGSGRTSGVGTRPPTVRGESSSPLLTE